MVPVEVRFAAIYRSYFKHIHAYCRRRISSDRVDDATAEVFLAVWRRIDEIPDGEASLPWLYGLAYGVVSNVWRGASRRQRLTQKLGSIGIDPLISPEEVVVLRHEAKQIVDALQRLRAIDQEVLRLSIWEDLKPSEIAQAMNVSKDAARQRLSRALKALTAEYNRLETRSSVTHRGGAL